MISEEAEKALLRLVESGVSESAERLATLSRTTWQTQTVSIREVPLEKFADGGSGGDQDQHGSYFAMPGGVFLVMFPKKSAPALAAAFVSKAKTKPEMTEKWAQDTLAEIANVIVHAVANTMADACGDVFFLSAPSNAVGKRAELVKDAPNRFERSGKTFVLMAYVHMLAEELSSDCSFVLLLSAQRRDKLLKALDE